MKTALITGAGGGLGSSIIHTLAKKGLRIIAIDRMTQSELENKFADIKDSIELFLGGVDFSLPQEVHKTFLSLLPHRELSILVNNAGVSVGGNLESSTLDDWNLMMNVNLTVPFILSQEFVKNARQCNIKGSIINISSMVGIIGAKKPGYAASKAGMLGLTKSVAMQAGPTIRCNAIYPGATATPMTADWDEETKNKIVKNTPIGHIAQPVEIAQIVSFLADDEQSGYLTGSIINATGGQYLGQ